MDTPGVYALNKVCGREASLPGNKKPGLAFAKPGFFRSLIFRSAQKF
jgi:hypothetical protein